MTHSRSNRVLDFMLTATLVTFLGCICIAMIAGLVLALLGK